MNDMPLQQAERGESALQASKWNQVQMLIDANEMHALFDSLGSFSIYLAGALCLEGQEQISKATFLQTYASYVDALKHGEIPSEKAYRSFFSAVFTLDSSHLFQQAVNVPGKSLIRVAKPCIQLQMLRLTYSDTDAKFRAMLFGADGIHWGLQFAYPQLYMDGMTKEIWHVKESDTFPNTTLFRLLQRWARKATIPTPFLVGKQKTNTPMRLGKECLSWINTHPQLKAKGIAVLG